MEIINSIIIFLAYVIPLYIANSTPVLIHGKVPLDLGKKLFGKPILGKGKTIVGTIAGILSGSVIGAIIVLLFPLVGVLIPNYLTFAFFLSFGVILGDAVKSFFKRRFGINSGEKWPLADQLDFIVGGLVVSSFIRAPEVWLIVALLITTFFIHPLANWFAHKLKLKKVPW